MLDICYIYAPILYMLEFIFLTILDYTQIFIDILVSALYFRFRLKAQKDSPLQHTRTQAPV